MGDRFGTPGGTDKKPRLGKHWESVSHASGQLLFQVILTIGKSGLCSGQLANYCWKVVDQSTGHLVGPDHIEP